MTKKTAGHNNVTQYEMSSAIMELECIKYKEKMKADEAFCKHPGDYCKYRTSCIIQFMGGENKAKEKVVDQNAGPSPEEKKSGNEK